MAQGLYFSLVPPPSPAGEGAEVHRMQLVVPSAVIIEAIMLAISCRIAFQVSFFIILVGFKF